MTDISIPDALYRLEQIYANLESTRKQLGRLVSYSDEARDLPEPTEDLLPLLDYVLCRIEDTVDNINQKIKTLLTESQGSVEP